MIPPAQREAQKIAYRTWSLLTALGEADCSYWNYWNRLAFIYSTSRGHVLFVKDREIETTWWIDTVDDRLFVSPRTADTLTIILSQLGCRRLRSTAKPAPNGEYLKLLGFTEIERLTPDKALYERILVNGRVRNTHSTT